jgi:phenylacetate-CoA ligase
LLIERIGGKIPGSGIHSIERNGTCMEHYYQPEIECASQEQIRAWQGERLAKTVKRVYENVEFYKKKMDEVGVKPEDIHSVEDLHKLPFLTKDDLRDAYPYGLLAAPLSDCVRIQSTSGTTGRRVVAFYTQHDLDLWEDCCARAIVAAGGTNEDVVHVCYGYGLFTGGPGLNGGSHKVGSLTLPMSSGNTERQIQFMCDLGSTILCCTPSYAAYLAESIWERGLQDKIKLKAGIFGAEAWTEEMRHDIEEKLGITAFDIYGLTEISGPGVSFECSEQTGMHINEDHFIAEVINPKTGEVLPDGEKGELVFTSITKEAFPLIRYRTRDICILSHKKCSCGRTHVKMTKPLGRSDDMLIVKGVNVFPSQIETVLLNQGYPANYQIIVDRQNNSDTIEVQVEMTQEMFSDNAGIVAKREKTLVDALKAMLGIYVKVKLVNPKSIARSEGKAVRVIDRRNLYQG